MKKLKIKNFKLKINAGFTRTPKMVSGFTLIELLLCLSITAFILLMTSVFLSSLLESRIKNQTVAEVEQQGLYVMQMITQTVRNASSINTPTVGTSAGSLSVNTVTAGLNPTVFDLSSGVVRIKEGSGSPVDITNSKVTASGLTFQNLSRASTPGTVRISFTLTYINPSGKNEYNFAKTFISTATLRQP